MEVTSDAIQKNGHFDPRYTCDFDNSSPELRWRDAPDGTAGYAVIAEDPDAPNGLFTHWIVYNIPPDILHLPAGIPPQETLPNGIRQGINSYGKLGYAGPCPPAGDPPHRYVFRVYALRDMPVLPNRATREQFLGAIQPSIITSVEIFGLHQRTAQQKAG